MKHAGRDARRAPRISEHGFTLIELLAVIAIISMVTGLLVTILYQFLTIPRWGNAQLAVDSDLRNAGLWLVRDGNESASFIPGGTCGIFYTGPTRNISYTYSYLPAENALSRQDSDTGQTISVARHVSGVQCPSVMTTDTVAITLVSSSGDVSASQTFTVALRVD